MNLTEPNPALNGGRLLAASPTVFDGRDSIAEFLDRLDRNSRSAERRIVAARPEQQDRLCVAAVELAPRTPQSGPTALMETQTSLGLDLRMCNASAAPAIYSIALPVTGGLRIAQASGEYAAQAGEGLVIDTGELERIQVMPGTHLLEFNLPKRCMLTLGAELAPGAVGGPPRFAPLLRADLAQRLLFMVLQAASGFLRPGSLPHGRQMLSQRWSEMVALTLLTEQPMVDAPRPLSVGRGPSPVSLRRALEYIDSHAERDILLSDIAAAACVSASSLLRQFNDHLGMSPGTFVRQVRLDRARNELRRGGPGSVRELAQRWGYQNASKFSQAYLRRFGERPSDTHSQRG